MAKIEQVKKYLEAEGIDGWLLYDFHGSNPLTRSFLEISAGAVTTRRFFYWIPVRGAPVKLVHAIEGGVLDSWPGEKRIFSSWQTLQAELGRLVKGAKRVAMEYSPNNAIPYVSKVDGGTVDLVRSFGPEVVTSGNFLPFFTAVFGEMQGEGLIRTGRALDRIVQDAWAWIESHLKQKQKITEYDVQQKILADFASLDLFTDSPPIVAVNEHSADPHYEPQRGNSSMIQPNDWILIDCWAREKHPGSIFADMARLGVAGLYPTPKQQELFHIVREAQVAATELVKSRFAARQTLMGWEVDDAARNVIKEAGYGEFFIHRTGHSIDTNVHGSGANMDNLEMHDDRPLIPNTALSIEPAIYLPGLFGVRLEYDLYIHKDGKVDIIAGEQNAVMTFQTG